MLGLRVYRVAGLRGLGLKGFGFEAWVHVVGYLSKLLSPTIETLLATMPVLTTLWALQVPEGFYKYYETGSIRLGKPSNIVKPPKPRT